MADNRFPSTAKVVEAFICVAYDTNANWYAANPVLLSGQVACSSDLRLKKTGDGVKAWRDLSFDNAASLNGLNASITELNYVKGVTSNIQVQINRNKMQVGTEKPGFACTWFHVTS